MGFRGPLIAKVNQPLRIIAPAGEANATRWILSHSCATEVQHPHRPEPMKEDLNQLDKRSHNPRGPEMKKWR